MSLAILGTIVNSGRGRMGVKSHTDPEFPSD